MFKCIRMTAFPILVVSLSLASVIGARAQDAGPALKSTWKAEAGADSQRISVTDMSGDSKLSMLLLGKDGSLSAYSFTATGIEKAGTVELGKGVVNFAAGRFAKGKPGVIIVPGALFYKHGDKYVRKDAGDLKEI